MRLPHCGRFVDLSSGIAFAARASVEDPDWPTLDPAVRRQRMMATAKDLFLRCAQNRPLLLWFEDMQWTDVETRDVVEGLVDSIGATRLLVILTCRPEYDPRRGNKDGFTSIHLDPLQTGAADQLVRALLGNDAANAELRALIVERTEGTPLFIEETIRTLVESGVLRMRAGRYELTREIREIRIPETVQSVIAARIDSLSPKRKTLLQIASVIGSEIPLLLLREVVDLAEEELQNLLAELQAAQFLYETPNATSLQLKFSHALVHEVAYGGLISAKRQMLHARVLRAMESQNQEKPQDFVESLAHHALNAALWKEAVTYLCRPATRRWNYRLIGRRGLLRVVTAGAHAPAAGSRPYPRGDRRSAEAAADIRSDCGIRPARALPGRG